MTAVFNHSSLYGFVTVILSISFTIWKRFPETEERIFSIQKIVVTFGSHAVRPCCVISFVQQVSWLAVKRTIDLTQKPSEITFLQILYARAFPQSNLIQSSFILTIMGIINTIIFFPVPLSLLVTGVESVDVKDLNFGLLIACLICAFSKYHETKD